MSVGPSPQYKNEPNQHEKTVLALEAISNVTAPAQKHATDDAVYTALFYKNHVFKNVEPQIYQKLRTC